MGLVWLFCRPFGLTGSLTSVILEHVFGVILRYFGIFWRAFGHLGAFLGLGYFEVYHSVPIEDKGLNTDRTLSLIRECDIVDFKLNS